MPNFISAYDLQQRDGLTRQRVIAFAKKNPAYWAALGDEHTQSDVVDGYFLDEFKRLKDQSMTYWKGIVKAGNNINETLEKKTTPPLTNGKTAGQIAQCSWMNGLDQYVS